MIETESHPFEPFLPRHAKVLFLGTFPAKPVRWSMNFYYPNFLNDFWRVIGLIYFENPAHFEIRDGKKRWDETAIREFCMSEGLAFSDTAEEVRRLKGNASDAALEIVKPRDIRNLLSKLPECKAVVTTGGLASEVLAAQFDCNIPAVGERTIIRFLDSENNAAAEYRELSFYRMPSTSRAYPLSLVKKAEAYAKVLDRIHWP